MTGFVDREGDQQARERQPDQPDVDRINDGRIRRGNRAGDLDQEEQGQRCMHPQPGAGACAEREGP